MDKDGMQNNLVSDDITTANLGITLPERTSANYNISLPPLFINRPGRGSGDMYEYATMERGNYGFAWSNTTTKNNEIFYLSTGYGAVYPSSLRTKYTPRPLRCLVSTTNS